MDSITIREARPEEFPEIGRVAVAAYREYADKVEPGEWERMKEALTAVAERAEGGEVLVAEEDGRVVGMVVYFPPHSPNTTLIPREWASIRVLAVHPRWQRRGIGMQLARECIERARRDRAAVVGLRTSELMAPASLVSERLGFRRERELAQAYGLRYWLYALPLEEVGAA